MDNDRHAVIETVDCVVIGAGVVGLAIARELAMAGRDVIVAEAADAIGTGISSRNSEVIHAGLYYAPGSLKARLCVEGKQRLYAYCAERGIAAKAIGKLLVATKESQLPKLQSIHDNAKECGVRDLAWLSPADARALEREVRCAAAVFSPSSGIVDSHAFMLALRGDIEDAGGMIAFNSPVEQGAVAAGGVRLHAGGKEPLTILARLVVNAAGLPAPHVAASIEGMPPDLIPKSYLAKGNYFSFSGRSPFSHLIYPMPDEAGLGVHATIDLGGAVKFGPDVEWVDTLDYTVNANRQASFETAIREYWAALPDNSLSPGYAGIRPKLVDKGKPAADFKIQGPAAHGVNGLWNVFGIESPGLTASLALASMIRRLIET